MEHLFSNEMYETNKSYIIEIIDDFALIGHFKIKQKSNLSIDYPILIHKDLYEEFVQNNLISWIFVVGCGIFQEKMENLLNYDTFDSTNYDLPVYIYEEEFYEPLNIELLLNWIGKVGVYFDENNTDGFNGMISKTYLLKDNWFEDISKSCLEFEHEFGKSPKHLISNLFTQNLFGYKGVLPSNENIKVFGDDINTFEIEEIFPNVSFEVYPFITDYYYILGTE